MNEPNPIPPAFPFKDRRTGLTLSGSFTVLLGGQCALFVDVHDLVRTRTPDGWQQGVGFYRKRCLDRRLMAAELETLGLAITRHDVERGLVALLARKRGAL